MNEVTDYIIGAVLGVLVSVPFAVAVSVSVRARRRPLLADLGAAWQQPQSTNIVIEAQSREIALLEAPGEVEAR